MLAVALSSLGSQPRPAPPMLASAAGDDAGLLAGLRQRDEAALAALYDRYGRLAFSLAYRIVGNPAAAEEVVQDAFLSAWRRAASYDPGRGAVRTWLLAIVHHRAIDHLRHSENRRGPVALDRVAPVLAAADVAPATAEAEERACVRRAMLALPADQRRTVELAYFGGLTQPAIAAAMGVPVSTVKGRIRLALPRLRAALAEPDDHAG